jgi:putative ABC transport system substrate-binding protein
MTEMSGQQSEVSKSTAGFHLLLAVCAMLFVASRPAEGQQPAKTPAQHSAKIPRIGYLAAGDPSSAGRTVEAFRQGLRDLGYIEGKTILFEYRFAEGKQDRVPNLVKELVQVNVDVLVVIFLPGIRAAKEATNTIPIVMVAAVDPVATGIVESFARPGGNITGVATLQRDLGREETGVVDGSSSTDIARRGPLGRRSARVGNRL